ncbi:MAG: DUF2157 domain-containing protein [bacterium]
MPDSDFSETQSEKSDLLESVRRLSAQDEISRPELIEAFHQGKRSTDTTDDSSAIEERTKDRVSKTLYYTGGLVVFLGLALLVFQNWTELSRLVKILLTLASGAVALGTAVLLDYLDRARIFTRALYYLAGLLLPLGLFVTHHLYGFNPYSAATVTQVTGMLFVLYLVLYRVSRRTVVLTFCIIFGSWCYFGVTDWLFVSGDWMDGAGEVHRLAASAWVIKNSLGVWQYSLSECRVCPRWMGPLRARALGSGIPRDGFVYFLG